MTIPLPLRLGFFLEFLVVGEAYVRFGRNYRGIDRTLAYTGGDFLERAATKTFPRAWEEYWEAEELHGVLVEGDVARRCRDRLKEIGVDNEIVYAEMVAFPNGSEPFDDPMFFLRRHDLVRRPGGRLRFLGHDVSGAVPTFHSYLNNPGLDRRVPELAERLNEFALVDDAPEAEALMREAQELGYSRVPTVIEIWLVE
jgi:hypothetical protein